MIFNDASYTCVLMNIHLDNYDHAMSFTFLVKKHIVKLGKGFCFFFELTFKKPLK